MTITRPNFAAKQNSIFHEAYILKLELIKSMQVPALIFEKESNYGTYTPIHSML
jgi:hypothetical protein